MGPSEAENMALAAVRERSEDIQMSDDSPSHMNLSSVPLAGAGMAKIDQERSQDDKDANPMSEAQMLSIIKSNSKAYVEVLGQVAKDMTSCQVSANQISQFLSQVGSAQEDYANLDPLVRSHPYF